jgi:hypothetical protein
MLTPGEEREVFATSFSSWISKYPVRGGFNPIFTGSVGLKPAGLLLLLVPRPEGRGKIWLLRNVSY